MSEVPYKWIVPLGCTVLGAPKSNVSQVELAPDGSFNIEYSDGKEKVTGFRTAPVVVGAQDVHELLDKILNNWIGVIGAVELFEEKGDGEMGNLKDRVDEIKKDYIAHLNGKNA